MCIRDRHEADRARYRRKAGGQLGLFAMHQPMERTSQREKEPLRPTEEQPRSTRLAEVGVRDKLSVSQPEAIPHLVLERCTIGGLVAPDASRPSEPNVQPGIEGRSIEDHVLAAEPTKIGIKPDVGMIPK